MEGPKAAEAIWFESADLRLSLVPEAWAAMLLLPALHFGARVEVEAALDRDWLEGLRPALAVWRRWWDYPAELPLQGGGRLLHGSGAPGEFVGQCFTGGVDSFFTLLHSADPADVLLYVQGFDVALGDVALADHVETSLRRAANRLGRRLLVLRSNLREHPAFRRVNWERTHGAALAAAGMVASGTLRELRIPASYAHGDQIAWGSHWETDHVWSLPGRLAVVHDGAETVRPAKIRQIAHDPLVREHLRVCWESRGPELNCARCEKCLRTRVAFAACGHDEVPAFAGAVPLHVQLDGVKRLPEHLVFVWEELLGRVTEPRLRQTITRLVARSSAVSARRDSAH
ncbi:MAG: hypothetical protein MJE66_09390 [Proteobacteria bacterium]|nr:hypothetical protein [Pseudomonadota bacterium]